MPLGPWNTPPNFLGAMQAGASAGLQLRGQNIAAAEAAQRAALQERGMSFGQEEAQDRLALAYKQLASEELSRNETVKARMQQNIAANMLRQSQIDMLSQWHQAQAENQRQAVAERAKAAADALEARRGNAETLDDLRQQGLDVQREAIEARREGKAPTMTITDEDGNKITGPLDDPEIHARAEELRKSKIKPPGLLARLFGSGTPTTPAASAVSPGASLAKAGASSRTNAPTLAPTNAPTLSATTPSATGRVRVKRPDGKFGSIPASQLDAALEEGYTKAD